MSKFVEKKMSWRRTHLVTVTARLAAGAKALPLDCEPSGFVEGRVFCDEVGPSSGNVMVVVTSESTIDVSQIVRVSPLSGPPALEIVTVVVMHGVELDVRIVAISRSISHISICD